MSKEKINFALRLNQSQIERSFEKTCITTIVGPRRVGKSTLVGNYSSRYSERLWVSLNMDQFSLRQRIERQELELLISEQARQEIGGQEKIWVVIDEAQKCPEIFDQIKILYDQFVKADKIKFILTGSGYLNLYRLTAETLAGRIETYYLSEFTIREAGHWDEDKVPLTSLLDLIESQAEISDLQKYAKAILLYRPLLKQQLEHHLLWGGLPEVLETDDVTDKIIYLNNYIDTYLEKDIRAIENISDIQLYRNLMEIIAEQTGSLRDDVRLINALSCSRNTLIKYRGYLHATLFYEDLFPYIATTLKRIVKSPKGYLLNNGMISALTNIADLDVLESSGLIGHRLENWFLLELKTWLARNPRRSKICFWRLSTGVEVDFVVVKKPNIYPFEVTYGTKPERKKVNALRTFMADEPKAKWGYYVYRGEFNIDEELKICFIPAWMVS